TDAPSHTYAQAGTYTVKAKVTSSEGCVDSVTREVVVFDKPDPGAIQGIPFANIADTSTYRVKFTNGSTYEWFNEGEVNIDVGQGTNVIKVSFNNMGVAILKVVETNIRGCIGDTVTMVINVAHAGIARNGVAMNLEIYPNPGITSISIAFTASLAERLTFTLTDALGRTAYSELVSVLPGLVSQQIDISNLSPGTYTLSINGSGGISTAKIVVLERD
nr:T9SS type A sorting domain-containing protein [Bacteroidota bacterium]